MNKDNHTNLPEEELKEMQPDLNLVPGESQGTTHQLVHLPGMYKDWFLDYASYVILERAVPHINDGLKPVHRRILHAMKNLDDGRYNKVANLIGNTMQYHPHGDASIGDALVQLGQKELLIDMQGNWGNILTGDGAAAPRYIEARLSKFALDVVFNPKTTNWKSSYDGRNKEPITLPVKFPLLLAQGVEGIAVGLASKILPHNFLELIDASIAHLEGKDFEIYPDFPTGGSMDVTRYNDGLRGGAVRVRAKIDKLDKKTLVISEIPFGKNTGNLIETILKANEKGKIKIKKVDDNTSEKVEIVIHLAPGVSSDKTIDALYAFSDCELSISPNSCIIEQDKPRFLGVKHILKVNTDNTKNLLLLELNIRKQELQEDWHYSNLEKIFIENRIYRNIEECETFESIIETIDEGLQPFKPLLQKEVTRDDIIALTEIKIKRISRFDSFKADQRIKSIEEELIEIENQILNIIPYSIKYFKEIKAKYGKGKERKTEIRNFDTIIAAKVAVANEKLYVNRTEGFIGYGLKREEYVCDCSDIDDIIVFRKNGKFLVTKISEKSFVGKDILYLAVFKPNDERTIYNLAYRHGKTSLFFIKRFFVKGITRDKEYDATQGAEGSRLVYFSANPNGEAEIIRIILKPKAKLRKLQFEQDFGEIVIKTRTAKGNILSKNDIHRITLKEKGLSTLGGRKVWFDEDVARLNTDERGRYLGEFLPDDKIFSLSREGWYQLTSFDVSNHYPNDLIFIEKFKPGKTICAIHFDGEQNFYYLKRFEIEETDKQAWFINDENKESSLVSVCDDYFARLAVVFGGKDKDKPSLEIDVNEFISIKGYKARGKRITNYEVKKFEWLEPIQNPETEDETDSFPEKNTQSLTEVPENTPAETQIPKKANEPAIKNEVVSSKKSATKEKTPNQEKISKTDNIEFEIEDKRDKRKNENSDEKPRIDDKGQFTLF